MSMQGWLAPEGAQPRPVQIDPGAPFNIIYSSGTTGTPKGIVQPHRMRWAHVHRAALARLRPHGSHAALDAALLEHDAGRFLPTLARGGTAVLMAKFDARKFLQLAQRHGVDARDAGAGAVPAPDGAAGLRRLRPVAPST